MDWLDDHTQDVARKRRAWDEFASGHGGTCKRVLPVGGRDPSGPLWQALEGGQRPPMVDRIAATYACPCACASSPAMVAL
jgi:hypothetical protein